MTLLLRHQFVQFIVMPFRNGLGAHGLLQIVMAIKQLQTTGWGKEIGVRISNHE
ncbi:hypothetical protein D3C87_1463300 [compost metagenome]